MQENGLKKFRTIVSEVASFVGNPVVKPLVLLGRLKLKRSGSTNSS